MPAPRKTFHPIHLAAWRKYRGLSQEQLAERIGCSVSLVSYIERGKRQYDQEFLEAAAEALNTEPSMLLRIDPMRPDAFETIFEQLRRIPEGDLPRLSAVIDAMFSRSPPEPDQAPAPKKRKAG